MDLRDVCLGAGPVGVVMLLSMTAAAQQATDPLIEEVIVTGTPGNQSSNELAQSVTVVGGAELDRVRTASLGETLETQLGMSSTAFAAGASRPIIRGLAGARVRTLEDGIEAMDASTVSADHAVGIDPVAARQIEIFRGPTTLLYGSGAVGGVVNTVTNRLPEGIPPDGFDASVEVRGDTVADMRAYALAIDAGSGSIAWHLDAADRKTDDYAIAGLADPDSPDGARGRLPNSDLGLTSLSLGASWLGPRATVGIAVSTIDSNYGVPAHEHEGEAEAARIDLEQTRVDLKGNFLRESGPIDEIRLRIGSSDYAHLELEGDTPGTRFDSRGYEARLELMHSPGALWMGALGLQFALRDFSALGDEAFVPPVETRTQGIFLLEQRESERWTLSLGGRYERQEHLPTAGKARDDTALSVSGAAIRAFARDYAFAINLASAERMPSVEELFSYGPHLATESFEVGNADLRSETARHLDLGLRRTAGTLTWAVTAYLTDYADFIYLRDTGQDDLEGGLPIFFYSQQDARFHGVEAELFTPIARPGAGELDLRIFGDTVRAKLANGNYVPRVPPYRYGARLSWHSDRVVLALEAIRYADQAMLAPFETPTAGFTQLGADLEWEVATDSAVAVAIFARASNLLDEDARRHTSLVKEIAPLPGRNLSFGVRATF